ncbi:hypothetical protein FHS21_004853 [Phyllobacterium trifolii]|uniref:Uncharacterized protein n=1 Tax=Phyllobacterium trifolii TaxID=300193 RepID=A0A839UBG8_9HYPH|nr:hypothetical protein [Phyllobacterium trifolii]MBB3148406.1 hypothetical protein [Phyllobacterium trifolii]
MAQTLLVKNKIVEQRTTARCAMRIERTPPPIGARTFRNSLRLGTECLLGRTALMLIRVTHTQMAASCGDHLLKL